MCNSRSGSTSQVVTVTEQAPAAAGVRRERVYDDFGKDSAKRSESRERHHVLGIADTGDDRKYGGRVWKFLRKRRIGDQQSFHCQWDGLQ